LKALKIVCVKKEETVVLEDSLYAVQTAKKAGFYTAAVYDSSSARDAAQIKKTADVFLNSLDEWEKIK